jgi:phage baseplate assembly protein W
MADRPHFQFPFELCVEGGRVCAEQVEQDTPEHVMSCENVIVRCPVGFRVERPDYGVPWPEYATQIDPTAVLGALYALESRSSVSAEVVRDWVADAMATISVYVEVESG